MNLNKACEILCINYDETLNRFAGVEALYIKFLKKFLEDETFLNLKSAWEQKDFESIEKYAHTLKGVSGNLGLNKLFELCNKMVQDIRNNKKDNLENIYNLIVNNYENIIDVIKNLD